MNGREREREKVTTYGNKNHFSLVLNKTRHIASERNEGEREGEELSNDDNQYAWV